MFGSKTPESREVQLWAEYADIKPAKLGLALADPKNLFKHLNAEELVRLNESAKRMADFSGRVAAAFRAATPTRSR